MPWPFSWGDDDDKNRDSDGDDSTSSSGGDSCSYTESESAATVTDTDTRGGMEDDESTDTGTPRFPQLPDLYSMWAPSNMYMEYQAPESEFRDQWEESNLKPMLQDAQDNITEAWNQVSMCFGMIDAWVHFRSILV
jgi:hypothetical protein